VDCNQFKDMRGHPLGDPFQGTLVHSSRKVVLALVANN
jgi:hypothetical protein